MLDIRVNIDISHTDLLLRLESETIRDAFLLCVVGLFLVHDADQFGFVDSVEPVRVVEVKHHCARILVGVLRLVFPVLPFPPEHKKRRGT